MACERVQNARFRLGKRSDGAQSLICGGNATVKSNRAAGPGVGCVRSQKTVRSLFTAASVRLEVSAPVDRAGVTPVTNSLRDLRQIGGKRMVRRAADAAMEQLSARSDVA